MRRTVAVLQDDIDHGQPGHSKECPVARAVRRDLADLLDLGGVNLVQAYPNELFLNDGTSLSLPPEVADFIEDFDCCVRVEPFKFEIEVP